MSEFICERCFVVFTEKKGIIQHLKKKKTCISIGSETDPQQLILELTKKEGIECKDCNRIYKNKDSLRKHNCKENELLMLKKEVKKMKITIQDILNNPNIIKNYIENNQDQSIHIQDNRVFNNTINCFFDTSGRPIDYLVNQDDIKDRILGWMKSKHGLLNYIDEKFYNKEHPENRMIKIGDDRDSIELHISGRWKRYENGRAIDYVLIHIGNDFNIFMEILRDEEDYEKNKKLVKVFQNDVMVPLEWGLEISEDGTQQEKVLTLIKNKAGEIVIKEDEDIMIRRDGIKGNVLEHIYNIKEVN
jgi:hypothetical protein